MRKILSIVLFFLLLSAGYAQSELRNSGGVLMPEQASYDVKFYDLTLFVNPDDSTINGTLSLNAKLLKPVRQFVLDLDYNLTVAEIRLKGGNGSNPLNFRHTGGKLWIELPVLMAAGNQISLSIDYGGKPLVAPLKRGDWADGFTWTRSKTGEPWLGVVSVLNGADTWWPCKDHPSDEADSMALHITVPEPLTVVANGKLRKYTRLGGLPKLHKFDFFISTPINNYGVTLNIAQYSKLQGAYRSINGERVPVTFWVMPENYVKAMRLFAQIKKQMRFLEQTVGPYPFRAEQYSVVQTPYLGMEHQTVISYGGDFTNNKYGFDDLHFHELTHEWFANMATAADWKDWWLHEGIACYLEALYAESLHDVNAYHEYIATFRSGIRNETAVAPTTTQRARDIYNLDLYYKGAWILHSLRYLVGKEALIKSLRLLAYPDPALEYVSTGRQCHFVDTQDFIKIAEVVSGKKLEWFFDVYLRQPNLPELIVEIRDNTLFLEWQVEGDLPFPMPVEVRMGHVTQRVAMTNGQASLKIPGGVQPLVDPNEWILKKKPELAARKYN